MEDHDLCGETSGLYNLCVSADLDRVVAVGGVDDDSVGLAFVDPEGN